MGRVASTWSTKAAVAAAIEANATLQALLAPPGIYNIMPPETTPLPYITFGLTTETDDDMFNADGTLDSLQLDIWTSINTPDTDGVSVEVSTRICELIFAALKLLLHRAPLTVDGFRMVFGTVTLVAILPDPDGQHIHGIARYDVTQREAA